MRYINPPLLQTQINSAEKGDSLIYILGLLVLVLSNPAAFAASNVIPPSLWSDLAMLR